MRIAVTYENGEVFQHFGHTEQFKLYDVEEGKVVKERVADTEGQGHGALAGFLAGLKVDTLICGGIGGGMAGRSVNKRISGEAVDQLFMVLMAIIIFISVYNTVRYSVG